jgi:hypothetical protein
MTPNTKATPLSDSPNFSLIYDNLRNQPFLYYASCLILELLQELSGFSNRLSVVKKFYHLLKQHPVAKDRSLASSRSLQNSSLSVSTPSMSIHLYINYYLSLNMMQKLLISMTPSWTPLKMLQI